jgi:putative ABC transport system permease protein
MKLSLDYSTDPVLWVFVGLVLVVTGLTAGLYPAFVLSRFRPAAVLASARSPGGGRWAERLRAGLVVFQFAAAILFTIGAGVILSQSSFLRKADLGFQRDGLIIVKSFNHDGMTAPQHVSLLTAWRATPGVVSATESSATPGEEPPMVESLKRVGVQGQGLPVQLTFEGPDFFQTYASVLVAGRLADRAHGEDFPVPPTDPKAPPTLSNVVLNETATKVLGFHDPSSAVGQQLNGADGSPRNRVIGVVRDIRFGQPRVRVPPMVYIGQGGSINESIAAVRYSGGDPKAMIARLGAEWRQIVPTEPFEAVTAAQALEPYYHGDDQVSRLLAIAAVLAVAIGAVGLYGLASFNTSRRAKEIGIRKTLGASTSEMLRLLIGQFLRPVLLANLIAWPLAYLAMRAYLAGFDQRIALSPLYFLGATILTLVLAIGTVAGQTYAVARAEPAKALRCE